MPQLVFEALDLMIDGRPQRYKLHMWYYIDGNNQNHCTHYLGAMPCSMFPFYDPKIWELLCS